MSLAVNNTQLQDLAPDHPFHAVYAACVDWIKNEMDQTIEFDFPSEMIVPASGEPGSRETYPPTVGDVPVHVYSTDFGTWEVRYFTQQQIKDGAMVFTQPVRVELGRRAVDKTKNTDLLFWLLFVNPYFDASDIPAKMKKYVNLIRDAQRHYVLVDLKKDAKKLVDQERLIAKAKDMLFGVNAITGSRLDNIAATFNVVNIAGKNPDMLLSDLNKILFKQNEKGFVNFELLKDFIRTCEAKSEVIEVVLEYSKLASTLLERGILQKFSPNPDKGISRNSVYVMDEKGERNEWVCDLRPAVKHIQVISEALAANPKLADYLQKRLKQ